MKPALADLIRAVGAAAGRSPGTLLLRRARMVNVFSGEIHLTDILLAGELIAAVGEGYTAEAEIDLAGRVVTPGLIDGHLHLESSLVEPREYARAVVPRGVTGLVCDPHEIANVLGRTGIDYILEATAHLPLDLFVTASSCVPATHLETSGATLRGEDLDQLLAHPRVVGMAELMNFPGIIDGDPAEIGKALLATRHRKVADGHAPLLHSHRLNAYLAAGIHSDHESSTLAEAEEKLRRGVMVMIREGSAARNLEALLPLIRPETAHQICLVTDDRHPHDLMDDGGVDHLVRRVIQAGIDPALAVRLASWNPARYFRLDRQGAIAPGYVANLVVLDDLDSFAADLVFHHGRLVARNGCLLADPPAHSDPRVLSTVKLPPLTPATFALPYQGGAVQVIDLVPGEILTKATIELPRVEHGQVVADPTRDLAKLAVIERHGSRGGAGIGLVRGFGLRRGAIASTVGHDAHNLLVAGVSEADMRLAAELTASMGGGFCAVADGQELARLPLPVAGLISPEPLPVVRTGLDRLEQAARELGVTIPSPFMALSFLALPVIPELRLTDRGLVRVSGEGLHLTDLHIHTP